MCLIREYESDDYEACLAVFASNVPCFFATHEQPAYAAFHAQLPCPYLVAELYGSVVGAGGYYRLPDDDCAGLAWGIVARDHQRRGVGSALLQERLRRLTRDPTIRRVRVKTSQRTVSFFQRFGFRTERVVEHHFGPGVHQYQMFLRLAYDAKSPNQSLQLTAGRHEDGEQLRS
jgi:ribosomal protein S18 acetylase RimI-like enzyme